jgi:hypothetical protein
MRAAINWSTVVPPRISVPWAGRVPFSHSVERASGYDGDPILQRLQRLQNPREFETVIPDGRPLRQDRSVGNVDEPGAQHGLGGGLGQGGLGRDHRIQKRQSDSGSYASQKRPAGQMLFRKKHVD